MDFNELIQPGMTNEETFIVEETHLAKHIGSGSARVLATPAMISFMERAAHRLIASRLPEGYSSVGVQVNVRHLAPTPAGDTVKVRAEVISIEGTQVVLHISAWDSVELVGDGTHHRVIIDVARFLKRVTQKTDLLPQPERNHCARPTTT